MATRKPSKDIQKQKPLPVLDQVDVLSVRHAVLLPEVVLPITVTRKVSLQLIRRAYEKGYHLLSLSQRHADTLDPEEKDFYRVGTLAKVLRIVDLPKQRTHVIIQGVARYAVKSFKREQTHWRASATLQKDQPTRGTHQDEIAEIDVQLRERFVDLLSLNAGVPVELKRGLQSIRSLGSLTYFIASHTRLAVEECQRLLEMRQVPARARALLSYLDREVQMHQIRNEIQEKTYSDIDQQQRHYFLRQQIKVLQNELGAEGSENDVAELEKRLSKKKLPKEAAELAKKELERLRRSMPATPEHALLLNHIEFMISLPWQSYAPDRLDIEQAAQTLARNHHGITKVKERILEHLAVMKLTKATGGSILCLVGPPGVGKTSLGRSIAQAIGRPFIRIALGGMHDEAEIRGHRKTYIGAMPGRILQQMAQHKVSNPLIMLDEIDKLHKDFHGDPASALLEVLDPAQNHTFTDNYLEVPYDLSKVFFIATANSINYLPPALRDRLEVIRMSGYTSTEKLTIARKHLLPSLRTSHGLSKEGIRFSKSAIEHLIMNYTREAGVRALDRSMAEVMRQLALAVAKKEKYEKAIGPVQVESMLGPVRYVREWLPERDLPGICTGLAWTESGGELLQVEATRYEGKGELKLSGQLGEVMRESALTSLSYLRAHAEDLGLSQDSFRKHDLHIHVPSGAVPKDGPSAGITMLTAVASLYTQRVVREALAMSGELTLSGRILPVGGIKEKLLAAREGGIRTLILSKENQKDVEALEKEYTEGLDIHYKSLAGEALLLALSSQASKLQSLK